MKPQCEKVLRHMENIGAITPNDAAALYHIKRLAARVCELRGLGYPIVAKIETGVNADGDPVRYAKYWVKKNG